MAYEQVQKTSSSFVPVQKKVSEFAPSASRVQAKDVTAGEQEQMPKVSTPATDANWLMKHPLFKGNQFLQRVVAPASESESLESEEETLQRQEEGNEAATPYSLPVQAKLTIGEPGDKYEQEADRVASQVVKQINSPEAASSSQGQSVQRREEPVEELQRQPSISDLQRSPLPLEVQRVGMPEGEELQAKSILQRREAIAGGEATNDLDTAINSARGGGQSLDAGLQRSMGQAMGADFSGVKVHTDAQSDQLNQSIQAKAFTTGQDVFFRQGAYDPGSRGGQELIAHELTHVVQQNGGTVRCKAVERQKIESENKLGYSDSLNTNIASHSSRVINDVQDHQNFVKPTQEGTVLQLVREKIQSPPKEGIDNEVLRAAINVYDEQINQIEEGEIAYGFIDVDKINKWREQYNEKMARLAVVNPNNSGCTAEEIATQSNGIQKAMRAVLVSLANMRNALNASYEDYEQYKSSQVAIDEDRARKAEKEREGGKKKPQPTPTQAGPIGLDNKWGIHRESLKKFAGKTQFIQYVPKDAATIEKALASKKITDAVYHIGKAFWVSVEGAYELGSSAGKVKMIYTFTPEGAKSLMEDYLICGSGDYAEDNEEEWQGEAKHPDYTIWKPNEIGAYGIGANRLAVLASSCINIEVEGGSGKRIKR